MKLHEIIYYNDETTNTILIEEILKRKKQLYTYYKDYFCCEPVLMVTSVFNAAQYGKIVPVNEFTEAVEQYCYDAEISKEDRADTVETIGFNSVMLKDL